MPERLKVLISAYACEPNKGSEPAVGWQLALHMAKFHDITVLTRANNQANIEKGLADYSGPHPAFIYYDLPQWVLSLKRHGLWIAVYYLFWQVGARFFMRGRLNSFDLIHHATFNSFRNPGCWWFCRKPVLVGPLGGGQICPWRFLPWFRKQIVLEIIRSLSVVHSYLMPHVYLSFYFADKILVANEDTANAVPWLFHPKVERMLETAVTPDQIIESRPPKDWAGVRLLWISRLDKLKGGELAVRAFALALKQVPGLTMTMVGRGREERPLKRLVKSLGVGESVVLQGAVPKDEITNFILRHDVFVFTSLRDTSGNVVLEAMAAGLPVITFRHQGVAEMTTDETARRVPITTRRGTVVQLGEAMVAVARSPELRERLGRAGLVRLKENYLWERHASRMDSAYRQVVEVERVKAQLTKKTIGIILAPKGILLALGVLFLVGGLEFLTVSHLKRSAKQIVNDTLPGLSWAGEANASLALAFNRTWTYVMTENPQERTQLRKEAEQFSQAANTYLNAYKTSIFEREDQILYDRLVERRDEYWKLRDRAYALVDSHKEAEAVALCKGDLLNAYHSYRQAGFELFDYSMRQGQARGRSIMRVCTLTQWLVAGVGIVVFIAGFLVGMSK
jgi:glycosyltransferase involved in cell wall biosynthesis